MEARVRLYLADSNVFWWRRRSRSSIASMCLQVPSVLMAKSGQEQ
jgi:hypothetical protein